MKFGKLTVIEPMTIQENPRNPWHHQAVFKCRCECESKTELFVLPSHLIHGLVTSCGCKKKGAIAVGMKSGFLEVVKILGKRFYGGQNQVFCRCRCTAPGCGKEKDFVATAIVQGKVKSCGCQWRKVVEVGDRYESLTVIDTNVRQREDGGHVIRCQCDCAEHNTIDMTIAEWNQHKYKSCGCRKFEERIAKDVPCGRYGHLVVVKTGLAKPSGMRYALCTCDCDPQKVFEIEQWRIRKGAKSCGCGGRVANGTVFGRLTVIDNSLSRNGRAYAECECSCKDHMRIVVEQACLKKGKVKSCGCIHREMWLKHGDSRTRLYRIWKGFIGRCHDLNAGYAKWYAEKGIDHDPSWKDWLTFKKWAIENGYDDSLTLDRIDGNKGYWPDNCRWATRKEQSNNKSDNVKLTFDGKTQNVAQWADELNANESLIRSRIRAGWNTEEALTTPSGQRRGWRKK